MQIAVLGAGMVGRTIARDLSHQHDVTSIDISNSNLGLLKEYNRIRCIEADLSDHSGYESLLSAFEYVICAVPGFMGFKTLETLILLKKKVVDISFFPENALILHQLAEKNGAIAIVDCGVAPGMSNLLLGRLNEEIKINSFECMVGGLPKIRKKPFEYKAPFSPVDVIEEYTRPARYIENGQLITRPALSEAEYIEMEGVGTLEAFNTDGLRSILYTMPHIPNMKEKTLRYPGHIDLIRSLQASGFFSESPVTINGASVRPLDVTSAILFNEWKLQPDEEELTVMTIEVKGIKEGRHCRIRYSLYDEYDKASGLSSMSRTTGYTCAAAMNLLIDGYWNNTGVYPPELIGRDERCFNFIMNYLEKRKVKYNRTVTIS